jgi:hypothetical protein
MNSHPYLRAYMAGIVVPTLFLLIAIVSFTIARMVYSVPISIEHAIVFPIAVVPNAWGAWNMLYVAMQPRRYWSAGAHGAVLPLILIPGGVALAGVLHIGFVTTVLAAKMAPVAIVVYYLLWKYPVRYMNSILGIS